jgi:hypothetical protein
MSFDRNSSGRERRLSACKLCLSPTGRPTEGGARAIPVLWGIDQEAVPVLVLTKLEATAINNIFPSGPLKILADYLSLSCPII